ncbi:hypothetical protein PVAP13_2KG347953 [Panicum virgatum]|uniref:Uncharacterized protein n=1 Tax=Panicum virgatum TaxID=38727 RepID=A0A8T0W7Q7_PANVG|nr:hypothetical protein PVAP13_2KG347953 [Panicum virgatum]
MFSISMASLIQAFLSGFPLRPQQVGSAAASGSDPNVAVPREPRRALHPGCLELGSLSPQRGRRAVGAAQALHGRGRSGELQACIIELHPSARGGVDLRPARGRCTFLCGREEAQAGAARSRPGVPSASGREERPRERGTQPAAGHWLPNRRPRFFPMTWCPLLLRKS